MKGFAPIDFQGSLNGAGFKIVDLYIESSENNVGLFKTLSGMVEDMEILDPQIKGESYVGALAGQAKTHYSNRSPVIRGVTLRGGSVEGAGYVGGLVGNLEIPADDIQVKETQIVASASYVGGLFGRIKNQSFRNLVFDGLIHVKNTQSVDYIGGFFSWSSTHSQIALEDSYSSGNIIVDGDARYVGGLAGRLGWYNYGLSLIHI